LHIGFRTSGGRGEYELVSGASGQSASDLEGWTFHMMWFDGQLRDTLLWLDPAGSGKPRLRSLAKQPYQIGRLMTAMLMLPEPIRELPSTATGRPIVRAGEYFVSKVGFGPGVSFASPPDDVQFTPNYIEVLNRTPEPEQIGTQARWRRIERLYTAIGNLDPQLAGPVTSHQAFLATGDPVTGSLNQIVKNLLAALASVDSAYVAGRDPLPVLERRALLPALPDEPDLPPPDEISEEDTEVRARSAFEYRLARIRGTSGHQFSLAVREAYGHRCAFCGAVLGGIPHIRSGVDAAHILAWSNYDLDVIANGLSLCKNHHWAFDAGLMMPEHDAGSYRVRFTDLANTRLPSGTRDYLGTDGFVIPEEWLPGNPKDRPNPAYLERLYEDLSVVLS
jgi:hypothetical protein